MSKQIDMSGERHGSLTVINRVGVSSSGDAVWLYRCDCGNQHKSTGYSIRSGKTQSCPECGQKKTTEASITHGMTNSAEYRTWTDMKTRCLNPGSTGYSDYGGRGIGICDRWRESFTAFLEDMGAKPSPVHSIDRINTNGNYEPENCRWATEVEQIRNRRNTLHVTIGGIRKPFVEWCEVYGCTYASAHYRLKQGLEGEAIFKTTAALLTHKGITDTISGWSKRIGIRPNTIAMRINKYGWSVSRALTEGVKQCA